MKSGLEGRNNLVCRRKMRIVLIVSMKSGLEGRNNWVVAVINGKGGVGSQ